MLKYPTARWKKDSLASELDWDGVMLGRRLRAEYIMLRDIASAGVRKQRRRWIEA